LKIDGLTVRFGGVVALDDVDLTVEAGTIVGLIGPNGAGKTTLIDAVTGFVKPSGGTVLVDEKDLTSRPAYERVEAGVARSWQSLELLEDVSVLQNIKVASDFDTRGWRQTARSLVAPDRAPLNEAASAAVREFGLLDDLAAVPSDLPTGRRRLVGIARSVALKPSVLLLDEPAAGLSDVEARHVGTLIQRLAKYWGMAVLLVEHNVELVMAICDRVTVLDFGKVIAEGAPDAVRNDAAVIEAYLGTTATGSAVARG
jgi:sulfate-transporting ATPase